MKRKMSSKERLLASLAHQPTDHIPLCFDGICHGLVTFINRQFPDPFKKAEYYLELGADTAVMVAPPLVSEAGYTTKERRETVPDEVYPILHKEYITPVGTIRQRVRKTEDYPEHISLISDHNVPASRSIRYLVESEKDLDKLDHIMCPPTGHELGRFLEHAKNARKFCDRHGILMSGYLSGVGDPLMWFSGVERTLMAALQEPGFLQRYIDIIAGWNLKRMEIMIDAGVDLIVRRGWYESTDFWSPDLYRQFLFRPLKNEIVTAHAAGIKYTYVMNSGQMPLLDHFLDLGFDIYSNIDPVTPQTDLKVIKERIGDTVTMCGGVNNSHVLEEGSEDEVRTAVEEAVEIMAPGGGCILAPGDSLMLKTDKTVQRNFYTMVDEWKKICGES